MKLTGELTLENYGFLFGKSIYQWAFVRTFDVPYPSIYDQQGRTLLAFRGTLVPSAVPSTVIIDRKGRVAASVE